jgi:hypothetical protein
MSRLTLASYSHLPTDQPDFVSYQGNGERKFEGENGYFDRDFGHKSQRRADKRDDRKQDRTQRAKYRRKPTIFRGTGSTDAQRRVPCLVNSNCELLAGTCDCAKVARRHCCATCNSNQRKASVCINFPFPGWLCSRSCHRLREHHPLTLSSTDGMASNILNVLVNNFRIL